MPPQNSNSSRPSDARRQTLGDSISVPTVSNFFSIDRYYDAADKLYASVTQLAAQSDGVLLWPCSHDASVNATLTPAQQAKRQDYLDKCYVLGKRYCIFYTDSIPSHNYYGTAQYKAIQNKHTAQLQAVIDILECVVLCMDQYELYRAAEDQRIEAERQRVEQERLDRWRADYLEQQQQQPSTHGSQPPSPVVVSADAIQKSALDKLKRLQPPKSETPKSTSSSTRYQLNISDSEDDQQQDDRSAVHSSNHQWNGLTPLPPPLLPPAFGAANNEPTPPSYDSIVASNNVTNHHHNNNHHPSYGNVSIDRPEQPLSPPTQKQRPVLSMQQRQALSRNQYNKLQQSGRIQVMGINTYQGRIAASTNGCTVISALVAARHLNDDTNTGAISSETIQQVIDVDCGPILRTIRRKLGLGGHALIIPSDVHDYLVDEKILHQEYFAGAAGGNVMDPNHYGEFLKLLCANTNPQSSSSSSNGGAKPSQGKAAATFFFREHVISIVKFSVEGRSYYDLIDSMPGTAPSKSGQLMATRTRCQDATSLQVLLQWYASRKFSDSHCKYIDRNPWDDTMADVDPRVFQGFVWSN